MAGKILPHQVLPLWHRALETEFGVAVATNDRTHLIAVLYEARKQAEDEALEGIMACLPGAPHENEIWLVRKTVDLDAS